MTCPSRVHFQLGVAQCLSPCEHPDLHVPSSQSQLLKHSFEQSRRYFHVAKFLTRGFQQNMEWLKRNWVIAVLSVSMSLRHLCQRCRQDPCARSTFFFLSESRAHSVRSLSHIVHIGSLGVSCHQYRIARPTCCLSSSWDELPVCSRVFTAKVYTDSVFACQAPLQLRFCVLHFLLIAYLSSTSFSSRL